MSQPRYSVGIDLGTTNSAVAYRDYTSSSVTTQSLLIPQRVTPERVESLKILPSFLYLPGPHELPQSCFELPWGTKTSAVVGRLAHKQGSNIKGRQIASAKSWLCHSGINRTAPILPWGSGIDGRKLSPVEVSSHYLEHIRQAWNHTMASEDENCCLENQDIILTVPASFDEVSRELTAAAAREAGLARFTLLEEPQAAFYAWISKHQSSWPKLISEEQLILVCDIGGGTTDFNLIRVTREEDGLGLLRVAVGEHLLLGGDNMDLALARAVEIKLLGPKGKLEPRQWRALCHQCRIAKETLLEKKEGEIPISLLGTGRRVIGGTLHTQLDAESVRRIILDHFFQVIAPDKRPQRQSSIGFKEWGLPYATDSVIPKYMAEFLRVHASQPFLETKAHEINGVRMVRPDLILFNGAVFQADILKKRTVEILESWFQREDKSFSLGVLDNDDLALAVSRGASYYGGARRGIGTRIRGGSAFSFYIGVHDPHRAVSSESKQDTLSTVCIVPQGMEEAEEVTLTEPQFKLQANRPVNFSIYSSITRTGDCTGDTITVQRDSLHPLPPLSTTLKFGKKRGATSIPVTLRIRLTEYGTLDLWCESTITEHRWKLEFQARRSMTGEASSQTPEGFAPEQVTLEQHELQNLKAIITRFYGENIKKGMADNLIGEFKKSLGTNKDHWPVSAVRKAAEFLAEKATFRGATPAWEARWLNLTGFCLRPGFGYPGDDWRVNQLWKIYNQAVINSKDASCRSEWWILWRRVAGGLSEIQQRILLENILRVIMPKKASKEKHPPGGINELVEMWMTASALERVSVQIKVKLGEQIVDRIEKKKELSRSRDYWALSRIGARLPLYGPLDLVIPRNTIEGWIERLIDSPWQAPDHLAYALAQLGRKTGDRAFDIDEHLTDRLIRLLEQHELKDKYLQILTEPTLRSETEQKQAFGDSLPEGLILVSSE